jgi:hypothetical protein
MATASTHQGRGNPYAHRYKFGKITRPIDLAVFKTLMGRIPLVDRYSYPVEFVQGLNALFYWTGLRLTEVLGRKEITYLVDCPRCFPKGVPRSQPKQFCTECHGTGKVPKTGKAHRGIIREDMRMDGDYLLVISVGEQVLKHGTRDSPTWLHKKLPYVEFVIRQW